MKAQASGAKPKAKAGKRKVSHIRITRGANGFAVHHELEPNKTRRPGGGMMSTYEPDPKPAYFGDQQTAQDHVGGLMAQMGGDESGAPESGAAPAAPPMAAA